MSRFSRSVSLTVALLSLIVVEHAYGERDDLLPPAIQLSARFAPQLDAQLEGADRLPPPTPPATPRGDSSRPSVAADQLRASRYRPITEISVDTSLPAGLMPTDKQVAPEARATEPDVPDARAAGLWPQRTVCWTASCLRHRPLYFEEVNLERHGYSYCCRAQPLISAAHFFATIPALPYKMTVDCPRDCVYTLGHYRPGSCAPWHGERLPCDCRAGAVEAATIVGLIFLIP